MSPNSTPRAATPLADSTDTPNGNDCSGSNAVHPIIRVQGVSKSFRTGNMTVTALQDVDLEVPRGELVALVGRSGSGKTTLLNCIGGLDVPDTGEISVAGVTVNRLGERQRTLLRRDTIAFVFQTFGLIPMLSAIENVSLPMRLKRTPSAERERIARELLDLVGLSRHLEQRPAELSGGQQQRVAIARALANSPQVLIADEPTGQLDGDTGRSIMELLRRVIRETGMTAIVSTHDSGLVEIADRVIQLADGRVSVGFPGDS